MSFVNFVVYQSMIELKVSVKKNPGTPICMTVNGSVMRALPNDMDVRNITSVEEKLNVDVAVIFVSLDVLVVSSSIEGKLVKKSFSSSAGSICFGIRFEIFNCGLIFPVTDFSS